jgi:hypothetical protein
VIDKEQAEKIAGEAVTAIHEIIQSAMAVRGERFANAVGGIFNLHTITKGLAIMASTSNDKEVADSVAEKMLVVIAQISDSLLETLETDELREEAWKMAASLAERGYEAERRING